MSRNRKIFAGAGTLAAIVGLSIAFFQTHTANPPSAEAAAPKVAPSAMALPAEKPVTAPAANTIDVSFVADAKTLSEKMAEGSTAYDLMDKLRSEDKISFTADYYDGLGYFITSIGGINNDGPRGKYWTYYVNGEEASVGASSYVLKKGDAIVWKYGAELTKSI